MKRERPLHKKAYEMKDQTKDTPSQKTREGSRFCG